MSYRPQVVKRGSRRLPWPWIALSGILLLGIGWLFIQTFLPQNSALEEAPFTLCGKDVSKTQQILSELQTGKSLEMQDYLMYGETLNLYHQTYALGQVDPFIGKTLVLRNLCDGYEWVYMLEKSIDGQIPVERLPNGFYEIFIVDDLERKRLFSNTEIEDAFYTLRRQDTAKKVELIANQGLGVKKGESPILDQAYVFLSITDAEESSMEPIYDVVIDPAHSTHLNKGIERGRSAFSMIESNETLRMAQLLKTELESYGLKVLLTRDDTEEVVDLYGEEGRLYKAYQSQAKYYIELNMNFSLNPEIRGSRVIYSSYASNKFATSVFKAFLKDPQLVPYGYASRTNVAGVSAASRYQHWDAIPVIRETGGRILSAGTISELAISQNSTFNQNERFGMQAISLDMIFLSNETDASLYSSNMKEWAKNIALGMTKYLGVEQPS